MSLLFNVKSCCFQRTPNESKTVLFDRTFLYTLKSTGDKTSFMLSSTEHRFILRMQSTVAKINKILDLNHKSQSFILLINCWHIKLL